MIYELICIIIMTYTYISFYYDIIYFLYNTFTYRLMYTIYAVYIIQ